MRPDQHEALARYVDTLQDIMGLNDWVIDVMQAPCRDDSNSQFDAVTDRSFGRLYVGVDFFRMPPGKQRETLVHELIHAHLSQTWMMAFYDLKGFLAKPVLKLFRRGFRARMEYAVDAMAGPWASYLPLPSLPVDTPALEA